MGDIAPAERMALVKGQAKWLRSLGTLCHHIWGPAAGYSIRFDFNESGERDTPLERSIICPVQSQAARLTQALNDTVQALSHGVPTQMVDELWETITEP